jgi:hypothetical protein
LVNFSKFPRLFAKALPHLACIFLPRVAAKSARYTVWGSTMKKERRWLKSAIQAAKTEEVFLPWAMRRAAASDITLPIGARPKPIMPPATTRAIAAS